MFIPEGIQIGDGVFIGPGTVFCNDKRPPSYGKYWGNVIVKDNASIGANSTILPGITIGSNSLIGAGSVVVESVPDGEIWLGNPARFYKKV